MDRLTKYSIPFAGMAKGNHRLQYDIDDTFFELFENSVIDKAKIHVDLDFLKAETVLTLTFHLTGTIRKTCDRCLEEFDIPVDSTQILLVRFGEPGVGETDDIIVIAHSDHHLDVAQHIYDYLSLAIPMRIVHPDDADGNATCNPEFLEKLSGSKTDEEDHPVDPRWEALKNLGNRKN